MKYFIHILEPKVGKKTLVAKLYMYERYQTMPSAKNFMTTIAANVDNEKLSDEDFRQFIRNTLPIVAGIEYPPVPLDVVNYIVTTQGFSGKKVTECETIEQVNRAFGDCSFGALKSVSSPTGKDVDDWIPF